MKSIEIDDDLYAFIASQTKHIGESASEILRRLLLPEDGEIKGASNASLPDESVQSAKAPVAATTTASAQKAEVKPATKTVSKAAPKATVAKAPVTKSPAAKSTTAAKAPVKKDVVAPAVTEIENHNKDDIVGMVSKDALSTFTKRVDQFLFILSAAHKLNSDTFENVKSIIGKNRTYFATSKEALLENGSSTNPKAIPDSPFWVVTNNNTAKKVNMLEQSTDVQQQIASCLSQTDLITMQDAVTHVHASDDVINYILRLVTESRAEGRYPTPLSPRASRALLQAARAWAYMHDRTFVTPDDVQAIFVAVTEHRLSASTPEHTGTSLSQHLLDSIDPLAA